MAYSDIIYDVRDKIATITLNRPDQMNSLSPNAMTELHCAFDQASDDRDVKVIVLTGKGAAFCAGADVGPGPDGKSPSDPTDKSMAEFIETWHRIDGQKVINWEHMWRIGKPIIAAVNGWALGQGFWYQLAADITIASDRAVFGQPEVRHISNSSYLFTALCGWKAANRWALTGDHFDAQEAYRIGMVNEVVSHDALMERTYELARRLSLVPEPSLRLNKAISMQGIQAAGLHAALLLEGSYGAMAHSSYNEFKAVLQAVQNAEGVKAFIRERDAPFQPEPMGPRSRKREPNSN